MIGAPVDGAYENFGEQSAVTAKSSPPKAMIAVTAEKRMGKESDVAYGPTEPTNKEMPLLCGGNPLGRHKVPVPRRVAEEKTGARIFERAASEVELYLSDLNEKIQTDLYREKEIWVTRSQIYRIV